MGLSTDPDWESWRLGAFHPPTCGGHTYAATSGLVTDMRKLCEKAHRSTRKFQVLHHHEAGDQCTDRCEAYGQEVPRLAT